MAGREASCGGVSREHAGVDVESGAIAPGVGSWQEQPGTTQADARRRAADDSPPPRSRLGTGDDCGATAESQRGECCGDGCGYGQGSGACSGASPVVPAVATLFPRTSSCISSPFARVAGAVGEFRVVWFRPGGTVFPSYISKHLYTFSPSFTPSMTDTLFPGHSFPLVRRDTRGARGSTLRRTAQCSGSFVWRLYQDGKTAQEQVA